MREETNVWLRRELDSLREEVRAIRDDFKASRADIQELLFGFRDVWTELDRTRPDTWSVDEMIEILGARNQRGRAMDSVPATFLFVWLSSDHPYHAKQLMKAERMLVRGLHAVMPGTHI